MKLYRFREKPYLHFSNDFIIFMETFLISMVSAQNVLCSFFVMFLQICRQLRNPPYNHFVHVDDEMQYSIYLYISPIFSLHYLRFEIITHLNWFVTINERPYFMLFYRFLRPYLNSLLLRLTEPYDAHTKLKSLHR